MVGTNLGCDADFTRFRPKVIMVEAIKPISLKPAWDEWEPLLGRHESMVQVVVSAQFGAGPGTQTPPAHTSPLRPGRSAVERSGS